MKLEYRDIHKVKPALRNPKLHSADDIIRSIRKHGFKDPIIVDARTGRVVSGHGRVEALISMQKANEKPPEGLEVSGKSWLAPVVEVSFKDDAEAEEFALTVNRLVERGGWNKGLLEEMLKDLEPVGFDIIREIEEDLNTSIINIDEILATNRTPSLITTAHAGEKGVGAAKVDSAGLHTEPVNYRCDFNEIPGELEGVFRLDDGQIFSSSNDLGIPDLLPDKILSEIPKPLKTWGGVKETPDDGTSYYFYNFGSTPAKGVPYERAIASFFTTDDHVRTFLNSPRFHVGKFLHSRILGVVVPDVSLWEGNPTVLHMYSVYQANWLGRFMQEAGLFVIPRFEFFLPEVQAFSLYGIPKNTPTAAVQLHSTIADENIPWVQKCLITGLKLLKPGQLLAYVSDRGASIIQSIEKELAIHELILVQTSKKVRAPDSWTVTDPYLKELRQRDRRKGQGESKDVKIQIGL